MAAFELGHVSAFPDPFFGRGTVRVLTSDVSRSFPIPDAGLGAVAYMVEFLMGFMGDKRRWRTMPWMVTFFGILVVPLGVVSVTLIILQPLAVGAWCTPCLIAAAMLTMIALTLDEVVAMCQFLTQARREGQSLWRTFWLGGTVIDVPAAGPVRPDEVSAKAMIWGVALPWSLALSTGLGLGLMAAPSVFGSSGTAAHSDHLLGALIVTVSVISLADVGRALRYLNVVLAAGVIAAPWVVSGASPTSRWKRCDCRNPRHPLEHPSWAGARAQRHLGTSDPGRHHLRPKFEGLLHVLNTPAIQATAFDTVVRSSWAIRRVRLRPRRLRRSRVRFRRRTMDDGRASRPSISRRRRRC